MRKILIVLAAASLLPACDRGADVGVPTNPTPRPRPTPSSDGTCDQPEHTRPGTGINIPRPLDC